MLTTIITAASAVLGLHWYSIRCACGSNRSQQNDLMMGITKTVDSHTEAIGSLTTRVGSLEETTKALEDNLVKVNASVESLTGVVAIQQEGINVCANFLNANAK